MVGCDRYGDDVDAVQNAQSILPGKTNQVLAMNIAGARGDIDWQGGPAPQYNNPNIVGVTAVIKRLSGSGNRHEIDLNFINNRQTKQVALDSVLVDGKPQNLVSGALNLFLLQLE
jgi:hypothetical protein